MLHERKGCVVSSPAMGIDRLGGMLIGMPANNDLSQVCILHKRPRLPLHVCAVCGCETADLLLPHLLPTAISRRVTVTELNSE